jgi:hypothetical protein
VIDNIERNFGKIANEIGDNAIIAAGLNEEAFLNEVGQKYLGEDWPLYQNLCPALLITDSHPENITEASKRIFIPLNEVQKYYGNWTTFFRLLVKHARNESDELSSRLQTNSDAFDVLDQVFKIRPGFMGISIDFNGLVGAIRKNKKAQDEPSRLIK